jgi:hypothetical protein
MLCVEAISDDPLWLEMNIFSANDIRRMLDVEYISEIAIALLHGVQNKKSTLDRYYVTYENEFEQRENVQKVFRLVLPEIAAILEEQKGSRWKKKSDFYSLFLVFAEHSNQLPLSSNQRKSITSLLTSFGKDVDEYLRDNLKKPHKDVIKYANAVERAASDVANRKERHEVLSNIIGKVLKTK